MRKPLLAVLAAAVVATVVLVADPMGLFGPDFEFEDVHMRAAIEGTWSLQFTNKTDASTKTVKLSIRQSDGAKQTGSRDLVRSAAACGNRSFVRSAAACATSSSMPLEITVLEGSDAPRATGTFRVGGVKFVEGQLEVVLDRDPQKPMTYVQAWVKPTGIVTRAETLAGYTVRLERTSAPAPAATTPR